MEIHQNISQNTLRFLVEKIVYFKVDSVQKMSPYADSSTVGVTRAATSVTVM